MRGFGLTSLFGLLVLCSTVQCSAGFLQKVAKAISAPIKVITNGDIKSVPSVLIAPIAGPLTIKAGNLIGGPVGGALVTIGKDPVAVTNLTNVQYLQAVAAIKGMRAAGVIHNIEECQQVSAKIAAVVEQNKVADQQGEMTKMLGDSACNVAIGTTSGANPTSGGDTPTLTVDQSQALYNTNGFNGTIYQVRPISQCFIQRVYPILNGGPFLIMSDLAAVKWGTAGENQWIKVGQLMLDGSGVFAMREPLPDMPAYQVGFGANGDLYLLNYSNLVVPGPVGHCT